MMHRVLPVTLAALVFTATLVRADAFDNYINAILKTIPDSKSAEK